MDVRLEASLAALTAAATRFVSARNRRNPAYDWLTAPESSALADLRFALLDLERAEAKTRKGAAA